MSISYFEDLISWSKKHFSELPWRQNRSLYTTLVSEIMLQQTTVGTVKNHYARFLKRFPNIKSLAVATEEELLIEWKGLGYYRRAKSLRHIAIQLHENHHGAFPKQEEELLKLKGVGSYTANALISIGMDLKSVAVDANLERVLSRLYGISELKGPKLNKKIYELFKNDQILNFKKKISYRDLNEALMDLGRVYCKANTVECQNCPLRRICVAYQTRSQLDYPVQVTIKKEFFNLELIRVIVIKNNKVMAYQKVEKEWLHGQWELPTFKYHSDDKKLTQYPENPFNIEVGKLVKFKTSITKYKITNYLLLMSESNFRKVVKDKKYLMIENDEGSNLSTASHKALEKV